MQRHVWHAECSNIQDKSFIVQDWVFSIQDCAFNIQDWTFNIQDHCSIFKVRYSIIIRLSFNIQDCHPIFKILIQYSRFHSNIQDCRFNFQDFDSTFKIFTQYSRFQFKTEFNRISRKKCSFYLISGSNSEFSLFTCDNIRKAIC